MQTLKTSHRNQNWLQTSDPAKDNLSAQSSNCSTTTESQQFLPEITTDKLDVDCRSSLNDSIFLSSLDHMIYRLTVIC